MSLNERVTGDVAERAVEQLTRLGYGDYVVVIVAGEPDTVRSSIAVRGNGKLQECATALKDAAGSWMRRELGAVDAPSRS